MRADTEGRGRAQWIRHSTQAAGLRPSGAAFVWSVWRRVWTWGYEAAGWCESGRLRLMPVAQDVSAPFVAHVRTLCLGPTGPGDAAVGPVVSKLCVLQPLLRPSLPPLAPALSLPAAAPALPAAYSAALRGRGGARLRPRQPPDGHPHCQHRHHAPQEHARHSGARRVLRVGPGALLVVVWPWRCASQVPNRAGGGGWGLGDERR